MKSTKILYASLLLYALATMTSMVVMSVGAGTLMIVAALRYFSGGRGGERFAEGVSLARASVVLVLVCIMSLFFAMFEPLRFSTGGIDLTVTQVLRDSLKAWYLLLPFAVFGLFGAISEERRVRVVEVWLLAAGALAVLGFVQFYTGFPRPQPIPTLPGRFHVTLFFGHHLSVASILIFPFFVALSVGLSRVPLTAVLSRWMYLLGAGVLGVALFLTWSRMLWVALPVGLVVWCLGRLSRKQAIAFVMLLLVGGLGLSYYPPVRERLINSMGTHERIELWKANWSFFTQRPFLGVGWRKAQSLTGPYFQERFPDDWRDRFVGHAHNNVLEMLGGVGLLGFLAWLYWNFLIFRMAYRASCLRSFWGEVSWGVFCGWLVLHVNGLTQANFWEGKVLHQMMWSTGLLLWASYLASARVGVSLRDDIV